MATDRPNVLWVMTDQHRADLTDPDGWGPQVMPALTALARRGTVFRRAHTSTPACVPARVSLLTGRFPSAHRVRQNSNGSHAHFGQDLLDVMRTAGYETFFHGKPHMHRGGGDFDHFTGPYMHTEGPQHRADHAAFDQWLDDLDHGVATEPTPFPVEAQLPHRIVDDALASLRSRDEDAADPFFCWVSFPEPHNPYQAPEPYWSMFAELAEEYERAAGPEVIDNLSWRYGWLRDLIEQKRPGYDDEWRRYLATYLGMLRMIDDQIARLLEGLGDQLDNTVVMFLADHGDYVGEYGLQRKGAGLPEVLTRIPLIAAGPRIPAGVRDEFVSIIDLMPTTCDLIGAERPTGVQGRNLMPLLEDTSDPGEEFETAYVELGYGGVEYGREARPELHFPYDGRTFDELNSVTQSGQERSVQRGSMKLVMDQSGRAWLYDLAHDRAEIHNLADDPAHARTRAELTQWLARWLMRLGDDLPEGRYTPLQAEHNWRWVPQFATNGSSSSRTGE